MPRGDTTFKPGNSGKPKGAKNKNNWERIDDRMRRGGLAILAPFRDAETSKHIEEWALEYAEKETEKYIRDIFTPYVKALPPEIRVKVYQSLIQIESVSDSIKLLQVIQILLLEVERLGGDVEDIRAKLPADIG